MSIYRAGRRIVRRVARLDPWTYHDRGFDQPVEAKERSCRAG